MKSSDSHKREQESLRTREKSDSVASLIRLYGMFGIENSSSKRIDFAALKLQGQL